MSTRQRIIKTDQAPAPGGAYSQAVEAGGFLFCSGQIPIRPETGELETGDIAVQAEVVLRNLMAVLAEAGTGPEAVVKTTIFLKDMADFPKVNDIYAKFFTSEPPARACVAVAGLPKGAGVEIEAGAFKG